MDIALYDRNRIDGFAEALEQEKAALRPQLTPGPASGREALRWLLARLSVFGITRVADLTGLDRLGIPVMQACRPQARSNAVTQGKGRTRNQAALGAIMECLETWAAERIPEDSVRHCAADDLPVAWRAAHQQDLSSEAGTPVRCLFGWDIGNQAGTEIPEALVSADYTLTAPARTTPLPRATTGLGAGVTLHGAILHGLRECIEREIFDRALHTHGFFEHRQIALQSICDPVIQHWIERGESVGIRTGIWQLDTIAGQVGFWVRLLEQDTPHQLLPLPADGICLDADPVTAVRKAFLEAAQGRIATISGAREDITRAYYPRYIDPDLIRAEHRRISPRADALPFPANARTPTADPVSALSADIAALYQECKTAPIVVPLAFIRDGRFCVHVVRVVIPAFTVVPGHGMGRAA